LDITYREARAEDLPECVRIFIDSWTDLNKRHNFATRPKPKAARMLAFYQHALTTGIFRVAEAQGRIRSFACALVRDRLWFLSGFWTHPSLRERHIGMPLLRVVWEAGKRAGATTFFVWSSVDLPAMAAYMKMGMMPGTQIMRFEGTPALPDDKMAGYKVRPLDKGFAMRLDRILLGTSRGADHDYLTRMGAQGRQVLRGDLDVGYFYFDGGAIGPVAWNAPRHATSMISLACREAAEAPSTITLRVPGMNHAALDFALRAGLRLTGYSHLLMSAPFGHLEQYLPSGPAVF
jgi:hypothetical protein